MGACHGAQMGHDHLVRDIRQGELRRLDVEVPPGVALRNEGQKIIHHLVGRDRSRGTRLARPVLEQLFG